MRTAAALLLYLLLLAPALAEPNPLLARLVSEDEDVRLDAREEWDALDEEQRFRLALANLRSKDPEIAWFCADKLDPWRLNLEELRLRGAILARHPERYLLPDGEGEGDLLSGLGAADLEPLWRNFAKLSVTDPATFFDNSQGMSYADVFEQTHRQMSPEHIPLLVELLEAEDPVVFGEILWTLRLAAEFTDRHREAVAHGCLYALARFRAAAAGEPAPHLADIPVEAGGPGLPAAFLTLARHLWFDTPGIPPRADGRERWCVNGPWLLRWARELSPAGKDAPFLLRVARRKIWTAVRAWAVQALAGIDDSAARGFVEKAAAGEGVLAPLAAAEIARQGKPERFHELLLRPDPDSDTRKLALELAPEALWRHWLADPPEWSWGWDPSDLAEIEFELGLRIPRERFRPFVEQALRAELAPAHLVGLLVTFPDLLTRDGLDALVEKLLAMPPPREGEGLCPEDQLDFFAHLEVRAPDVLVKVLEWLAASPASDTSTGALCLLARLGDARRLDATLARLDEVLAWNLGWGAWDVGALRDDRVRKRLEELAGSGDRETASRALIALAVHHGLDPRLAPDCAMWNVVAMPDDQWGRFRDAALGGDPTGAAIALLEAGALHEDALTLLGREKDPRALAYLREIRARPTDQHWLATGGLALAGDGEARAQLMGWVRDARTVMLDDLDVLLAVAMELDPSMVDLQIERLESNCCLGFYAISALGSRFPTLDASYEMNDFPETKRRIREWYDRHRGKLVWSRIARGWVPGE